MKNLFKALSIVLFGVLIFSCSDDDDNTIVDDNNLGTGEVEIRSYPGDWDSKISFVAAAAKITIDWGDGCVDRLTLDGTRREFTHKYDNQDFRTIKISTEAMTYMGLGHHNSTHNELRFGNCPDLKEINSSSTGNLTILTIESAPVLTSLICDRNQLTDLDLSGCPALTNLACYRNQLTSLNISECTKLINLDCSLNRLTSLDVSKYTALTSLDCGWNQLTDLNASGCTALTRLHANTNQLTDLDVSGCSALINLYCGTNRLTSLDVSECTALTILDCYKNQFAETELNSLLNNLPDCNNGAVYIGENPGADTCDKSIATDKGWTVYNFY